MGKFKLGLKCVEGLLVRDNVGKIGRYIWNVIGLGWVITCRENVQRTSQMCFTCVWWLHHRQMVPVPTMFLRCSYPFPGTLAPSVNSPPQFVVESKLFCLLWFPQPDPLHNLVDDEDIRVELEVGVVSAQYLDYPRLTVHCNKYDGTNTHLIDDHAESVAIRLPGWSVVLQFRDPEPLWIQKLRTHPSTSPPSSKRHERVV